MDDPFPELEIACDVEGKNTDHAQEFQSSSHVEWSQITNIWSEVEIKYFNHCHNFQSYSQEAEKTWF